MRVLLLLLLLLPSTQAGRPKVHIQLQQLCDASQVPSSWLQLPAPTLLRMLGLLDTKQRARCARVCKAWSAAATSGALNTVAVATVKSPANRSLVKWLEVRAGHLCSLDLSYERLRPNLYSSWDRPLIRLRLDLPCSKLTQLSSLRLHRFQLSNLMFTDSSSTQATGNTGDTAPASGLVPGQGLQELVLSGCEVTLDALHQLEQLTGLTRLQLQRPKVHYAWQDEFDSPGAQRLYAYCAGYYGDRDSLPVLQFLATDIPRQVESAAYCRLLQALRALRRLELLAVLSMELSGAVLGALRSMSHLQHLSLGRMAHSRTPPVLALGDLPPTLTSLLIGDEMYGNSLHFVLGDEDQAQHARLQELTLIRVGFEVEALQRLSDLQHLSLDDCADIKPNPNDSPCGWQARRRWIAWLLAVGHFTQLRHLRVTDMALPVHDDDVADIQRVTALTASSQLTSLQVTNSQFDQPLLPKEALQHMLPPGKQLPHMKQLELEGYRSEQHNTANVTAEDIAHIAAACPALDTLHLEHVLADSAAVAALSQLGGLAAGQPSLTALEVAGAAYDDSSAAAVAQLTNLRSIVWDQSCLSRSGLQQLTALQGLSMMRVTGWKRVGRGMRRTVGAVGLSDLPVLSLQTKVSLLALKNKAVLQESHHRDVLRFGEAGKAVCMLRCTLHRLSEPKSTGCLMKLCFAAAAFPAASYRARVCRCPCSSSSCVRRHLWTQQ
jgi:hypothetical protein